MEIIIYICAAIISYLVASINPAIVMSKLIYHMDIRQYGSKNAGFTNFKRVFGNKFAWYVLMLDLFKGAIIAAIFANIFRANALSFQFGAAFSGLFALLGHAYPIWHGFKGGKGFLTYLSAMFIIDWRAGIIAVVILLVLLGITKYMSVSTVIAMLSCPITLLFTDAGLLIICMCTVCVLYIAIRHKENFKRLLLGTESKFSLRKKTSNS